MIHVAIVEDDPTWLSLMTDYLGKHNDILVVATALSREEAISLSEQALDIHVILMDVNLSGNFFDGINAALHFYENTDIKVVMLTAYSDKDLITNSFSAGACNYISKDNYQDIPAAIRHAYRGPNPMDVLLDEFRTMREQCLVNELSASEREILGLAKEGLSRSQMQQKTFKSDNTIKSQISSILKKMQVGTLHEAVQRIKRRGVQ